MRGTMKATRYNAQNCAEPRIAARRGPKPIFSDHARFTEIRARLTVEPVTLVRECVESIPAAWYPRMTDRDVDRTRFQGRHREPSQA